MGRITRAMLVVGVVFLAGACATAEDWRVWLDHKTHWASGEHYFFSARNEKDGSNPRVTRSDIEDSRQQNWWGIYAVSVSPSQIIQN